VKTRTVLMKTLTVTSEACWNDDNSAAFLCNWVFSLCFFNAVIEFSSVLTIVNV